MVSGKESGRGGRRSKAEDRVVGFRISWKNLEVGLIVERNMSVSLRAGKFKPDAKFE
jgi:hypothetical protein